MKTVFKVTGFLILSIQCTLGQPSTDANKWATKDSVLYTSPLPVLPYPFQYQLDSARSAFSIRAKKMFKNGATCVLPPTEKPKFFGVLMGNVVPFKKYMDNFLDEFPINSILMVELEIDWLGNIRRAKLVRYRGYLPRELTLNDFFENLKAIPAYYSGIPTTSHIVLPLRKSNTKINP